MKRFCAAVLALLLAIQAFPVRAEEGRIYYCNIKGGGRRLHTDPECPTISDYLRPLTALTETEVRHPRFKGMAMCTVCSNGLEAPPSDEFAFSLLHLQEKAAQSGGIYTLPGTDMIQPDEMFSQVAALMMVELSLLRSDAVHGLYMIYYYPESARYGRPYYDFTVMRETHGTFSEGFSIKTLGYIALDAETKELLYAERFTDD